MFGSIGFPELIIIFTIALLVFGPKKLPEVGRSIGKALREFRRTSDEIKEKIEEEIQADEFKEIKKDIEEITDIKANFSSTLQLPSDKSAIPKKEPSIPSEKKPEKKSKPDGEGNKVA